MDIHVRKYKKEFLIQNIPKLTNDAIIDKVQHRETGIHCVIPNSEYGKLMELFKIFNYNVIANNCRVFVVVSDKDIKTYYFNEEMPDIFWYYAENIGENYLCFPLSIKDKLKFLLNKHFIKNYIINY